LNSIDIDQDRVVNPELQAQYETQISLHDDPNILPSGDITNHSQFLKYCSGARFTKLLKQTFKDYPYFESKKKTTLQNHREATKILQIFLK
jgi:hypothetical protein